MVTKSKEGILVSSDVSEVNDPYNMNEEEKIQYLNKQKVKNRTIDAFLKSHNTKV
jgi:hypothetical protein